MGPEPISVLLGLGVAVMLIIAYLAYRSRTRRAEAFAAFAMRHGLSFEAHDVFGIEDWPFALFQRGDGRGVENVIHGDWAGTPVRAFDFWYYERTSNGGGSSKAYYRFTCAVTPIEATCAHLVVTGENVLTRIANVVVSSDLRFESEAFNRAFLVRCEDPRFATAFIDARMMDWMLAHTGIQWYEVLGDKLLIVRDRSDPATLPDLLDALEGFSSMVPRAVFSLYPRSG